MTRINTSSGGVLHARCWALDVVYNRRSQCQTIHFVDADSPMKSFGLREFVNVHIGPGSEGYNCWSEWCDRHFVCYRVD